MPISGRNFHMRTSGSPLPSGISMRAIGNTPQFMRLRPAPGLVDPENGSWVHARHAPDLGLGQPFGEQRVGVGLQTGGGVRVHLLAEVGPERDALEADRPD